MFTPAEFWDQKQERQDNLLVHYLIFPWFPLRYTAITAHVCTWVIHSGDSVTSTYKKDVGMGGWIQNRIIHGKRVLDQMVGVGMKNACKINSGKYQNDAFVPGDKSRV